MSTKFTDATCEKCGALRLSGDWPFCDDGTGRHGHSRPHGGNLLQAIHPTERAVIYRNQQTGEIRVPPRADMPIPRQYVQDGFERVEIANHQQRKDLEREGHFQDAAYYDNGSATADRELECSLGPVIEPTENGKERLTLKDLQDAGLQD